MIHINVIPAATATSQELLVEIEEPLCRPVCVNASVQPMVTVAFSYGEVTVLDENAIVPIIANVTVVTPSACPNGCATSQVFTEKVNVAFTATATNVPTLTPGTQVKKELVGVKCCKAHRIKATTSLTLSLA